MNHEHQDDVIDDVCDEFVESSRSSLFNVSFKFLKEVNFCFSPVSVFFGRSSLSAAQHCRIWGFGEIFDEDVWVCAGLSFQIKKMFDY